MCLPPACFETGFGFVSGFEEGWSKNFSKKIPKTDKVIEGEDFFTLDCNNYTAILNLVPVCVYTRTAAVP